MKKGSFIILSILTILALIVWFSCNPMNHKNQKSFNLLDETDFVKSTGGTPIGFASGVTGGTGGTVVQQHKVGIPVSIKTYRSGDYRNQRNNTNRLSAMPCR